MIVAGAGWIGCVTWAAPRIAPAAPPTGAAATASAPATRATTTAPLPEPTPVKGTLTKDGKPVQGGVVQFTPAKMTDFLVKVEVAANGKFELYPHGNDPNENGAQSGT